VGRFYYILVYVIGLSPEARLDEHLGVITRQHA